MEHPLKDISNKGFRITALLSAPIALVWDVWTKPEHSAQWWGPDGFTNTIHKMDMKAGGEWHLTMQGPDGKTYPNKSIFREIVPHKKIVFEHFNPGYLATITFETKGHETFMDWAMEFETPELFDIVVKTFKADEGQKQNVEKLEKYLLSLQ